MRLTTLRSRLPRERELRVASHAKGVHHSGTASAPAATVDGPESNDPFARLDHERATAGKPPFALDRTRRPSTSRARSTDRRRVQNSHARTARRRAEPATHFGQTKRNELLRAATNGRHKAPSAVTREAFTGSGSRRDGSDGGTSLLLAPVLRRVVVIQAPILDDNHRGLSRLPSRRQPFPSEPEDRCEEPVEKSLKCG
jgi:hypothetical protein